MSSYTWDTENVNESMARRSTDTGDVRKGELEALLDALPDSKDTRRLLDAVVSLAAQFFKADAAVIFLFQDGVFTPASWVGLHPHMVQRETTAPAAGLRAYVSRFMPRGGCRKFMSSPLLSSDHSFGELVVCSGAPGRSYYISSDRQLLTTIARRTADKMEWAQSSDRAKDQRGSISRIARTLVGERELAAVANRAVELAISELKADASAVWLASPREEALTLLAAVGFTKESMDFVRTLDFDSPSLEALAASTRQLQSLEKLEQAAEQELTFKMMKGSGMQSLVDVPLIARDGLVGVFSFARKVTKPWLDGDHAVVATMSDLLASSLLNAQLYEESERQRLLAQSLTSTLSGINEQLAAVNRESSELAEVAQQRAAELEATIANVADAIFVCDLQGKIALINDAGLEMIGESRTIAESLTLRDYLARARLRFPNGQPIPPNELAITRALQGEVVRGVQEVMYDARSGRDRQIVVSAAPIRDRKGRLVGAVEAQSDITRLKELDLLKDQFITVAAHEIKTPVTAIKGFAQTLLRSDREMDAKHRQALETIVRQSDRIDALVRDFLELSRMKQGSARLSLERIELGGLVRDVVDRMAMRTSAHNLYLSGADEVWVGVEVERMQEVVMNLLDNAIRYSPRGGVVEVRVTREGSSAVVSVRDEGMGIPTERQSNLFERFYRAHIGTPLDYGGLGVGLYISRETVREHGGEMWFESEEGKGSTFFFRLALAP